MGKLKVVGIGRPLSLMEVLGAVLDLPVCGSVMKCRAKVSNHELWGDRE